MMQTIFPDKEHFGRIFRNNAKMSSMGITQYLCYGFMCWKPIFQLCQMSIIVDKTANLLRVAICKGLQLEKILITKH